MAGFLPQSKIEITVYSNFLARHMRNFFMRKNFFPFFIVPFLIAATYLIFLSPVETFVELTKEDGLVEWFGAFFFLLASLLFLSGFFKSGLKDNARLRRWSWPYLFLGLLFFVAFGEEISWGQRIFGWETPAILREVNVQQELNLHNLKWFEPGDRREGLALFFTARRLFAYFGFIYFILIPLLYSGFMKIRGICDKFRLPIPPLWIGLLFFSNYILSKGVQQLMLSGSELPESSAYPIKHAIAELMESNWALIVAILATVFWINQKKAQSFKKIRQKTPDRPNKKSATKWRASYFEH